MKSKKKYIIYSLIAAVLFGGIFYLLTSRKTSNGTITVAHTDFVNKVTVSGSVVPAQAVGLSFQKSGIVRQVYYSMETGKNEGPRVKAGSLLAQIDTKDVLKEINSAEVALSSARLVLEKFKIENSEKNLNADLNKAYDDGFNAVSSAFVDFAIITTGLEDVLNEDNLSDSSARLNGKTALGYRNSAEKLYYDSKKNLDDIKSSLKTLDRNSPQAMVEGAVKKAYATAKLFSDAVRSAKNFVDYMAEDTDNSSEFSASKDTLAEYINTTSDNLSALSTAQNDINTYTEAFSDTGLDTKDLELTIKQKENDLADAKNKLSDYYIRAPFNGIITKIDAKAGETAAANQPLVKMMSSGTFQIESYVPEVNIALVKIGDEAEVTLDAYGENILFYATVVSIDPAETVRDGVSTYKVKLQFKENDGRIKSGMTANVAILIFEKPNVIVLPGGVVFEKNGKKMVKVKVENEILDREIILGDTSQLGQVEIVSGLEDGELVVLNPEDES